MSWGSPSVDAGVPGPARLRAVRVRYEYEPGAGVSDASLSVGAGETVAIMGPSGCGKSTLLGVLAGLLPLSEGVVELDGVAYGSMSERARSRLRAERFGFVSQFGSLVPELTIAENVAVPLMLKGGRARRATRVARERLAEFGIEETASKFPAEVSGGQRQRAAVARALAGGPSVVFADEPTGALDSVNASLVMGELLGAARSRGASVVVVTHDEAVAARADRVVVMRDGRVVDRPPVAVTGWGSAPQVGPA